MAKGNTPFENGGACATPEKMTNIEIKAKVSNLERPRQIALELGAQSAGTDYQKDTYFRTPQGRLKLRESRLSGNQLIPYVRSDLSGPKRSDYLLIPIENAERCRALLGEILGTETVVEKVREIYLLRNVRIHLDTVKDLGTFIEFEAVSTGTDTDSDTAQVEDLMAKFDLAPQQLLKNSYRELIQAHSVAM